MHFLFLRSVDPHWNSLSAHVLLFLPSEKKIKFKSRHWNWVLEQPLKIKGGFWSFDVKRIEIIWLGFSTYVEILIFNVNIEVHKSVFRLPIQVWNCYFTMDQLKVKWGNNCTSQAHLSKIQTDGVKLKLNENDEPEHRSHLFQFQIRFH